MSTKEGTGAEKCAQSCKQVTSVTTVQVVQRHGPATGRICMLVCLAVFLTSELTCKLGQRFTATCREANERMYRAAPSTVTRFFGFVGQHRAQGARPCVQGGLQGQQALDVFCDWEPELLYWCPEQNARATRRQR